MQTPETTRRVSTWKVVLDLALILLLSLVGEAAHFSLQQGKAVISGDSAQHVDAAEALLSPDKTPNFGMRKPGYSLILAGISWITGSMSWAAIAANHALLGLLPIAAYGLGYNLRSRLTGWVAAICAIAQFQVVLWDGRIMSEASYTCFMIFGILACAIGISRRRVVGWMLGAGMLLACAWLIRSVGVAVVAAAVAVAVWSFRHDKRRAVTAALCLVVPVAGAVLVECGLNLATSGQFRTSTGSVGIMLQTRGRYFQGSPFPDTETTKWFTDLLPEREPEEAYLANKLDGCVARWRAIQSEGMDEWSFNALALRSGLEIVAADPKGYIKSGLTIFSRHLLRQRPEHSASPVALDQRKPIIVHEAAVDFQDSQKYWYAYWFLPHRSIEESTELVARMRAASEQRAPFGRTGLWGTILHLSRIPVVMDVLGVIRTVGSLWPGFALLFCGLLGLNKKTCALLAIAYVLDAMIIGAFGSTDIANNRYQFVWIATDVALAACLVAPAIETAAAYIADRWAVRNGHRYRPAVVHTVMP